MKTLRVRLVLTRRSDLLCIACGFFLGTPPKPPRKPHWAVVRNDGDETTAEAGLHKHCEDAVGVRFTREPRKLREEDIETPQ